MCLLLLNAFLALECCSHSGFRTSSKVWGTESTPFVRPLLEEVFNAFPQAAYLAYNLTSYRPGISCRSHLYLAASFNGTRSETASLLPSGLALSQVWVPPVAPCECQNYTSSGTLWGSSRSGTCRTMVRCRWRLSCCIVLHCVPKINALYCFLPWLLLKHWGLFVSEISSEI